MRPDLLAGVAWLADLVPHLGDGLAAAATFEALNQR